MKNLRREFLKKSLSLGLGLGFLASNSFANERESMQNLTLNNGAKMPLIGFGTWQITGASAQQCVEEALRVGYRLIDTAAMYHNESEIGRALSSAMSSGLSRKELFITTKLAPMDYEGAKRGIDEALKKLGLDFIDLMLIHWENAQQSAMWRALEEGVKSGVLKSIGVSNFSEANLSEFLKTCTIKPVINQLETHVFFQRVRYQAFLESKGIKMQAYSPFAQGRNDFFKNETLLKITKKHGKTAAQVGLRYLVQRGISVIPKTTKKQRMIENISIFDFELDSEDLAQIARLETNKSAFGWFDG